jgi:hypothetical protein
MRRVLVLAVSTVVVIAAVFAGLVVSGAIGEDSTDIPPEELAFQTAEAARQATAEAGPHATKNPITPVLSCPDERALHPETGIWPVDPTKPALFGWRGPVENAATVLASNGVAYTIAAGALEEDGQQGILIVMGIQTDPCAAMAGLAPNYEPQYYETPFRGGPVTLTQIDGDTVVFQTADGTEGRLDFVTGTFITETPPAGESPTASETSTTGG